MLSVYLENGHKFSPSDILNELKSNNIQPNRVRNIFFGRRQHIFARGRGQARIVESNRLKVHRSFEILIAKGPPQAKKCQKFLSKCPFLLFFARQIFPVNVLGGLWVLVDRPWRRTCLLNLNVF